MNQLGLQLLQPCFGLLALRDVADEAGEKALITRAHLPDRELHGEGRAVLTLADHEPADADDATLSGLQIAFDVAVMILPVGRRHQHLDVFSDRFSDGVAELSFGRRAERVDDSPLVDDDHRIGNGFENRCEMRLAGKRLARDGRCANAAVLQLLAAPGDAHPNQREQDGAGDLGQDQAADHHTQPGCQQSRTQSAETGSNQHRRHKQQVKRGIAQHRRQRQSNQESDRDRQRRETIPKHPSLEERPVEGAQAA